MINMVLLKEAVLSNVTGLDAIQRAPIVPYKTKHKCLRIQNVAHCEPYEKWGYTNVSDNNYHSFQLRKDDIIISRTGGSIGSVMYISQDYNSVFNNGLIRLKIDTARFEPIFIYYCLKNKQFAKHIEHCSLGNSTQENIRMNDMLEYRIPNYPLDVQKRIASILWKLDEKMTNNNATCSVLEAMAKLQYDYWFVQYDFPDENGKPYKSSGGKMVWNEELKQEIPEGWECATIRELAREGKDKPYTSQNSLPTLDLSVMPSNSIILETLNDSSNFSTNLFEMKKGDILFGSIRPYLKKAGIAPCDGAVVGTVHCFRPIKADDYNFLAITLCNERMFSYATSASQGTKMPVITMDSLMNYKVAYDPIIARQFNDLGLQDVFSKLVMENKQLASLRDFLLPMIMNGQVKVKKGL